MVPWWIVWKRPFIVFGTRSVVPWTFQLKPIIVIGQVHVCTVFATARVIRSFLNFIFMPTRSILFCITGHWHRLVEIRFIHPFTRKNLDVSFAITLTLRPTFRLFLWPMIVNVLVFRCSVVSLPEIQFKNFARNVVYGIIIDVVVCLNCLGYAQYISHNHRHVVLIVPVIWTHVKGSHVRGICKLASLFALQLAENVKLFLQDCIGLGRLSSLSMRLSWSVQAVFVMPKNRVFRVALPVLSQ